MEDDGSLKKGSAEQGPLNPDEYVYVDPSGTAHLMTMGTEGVPVEVPRPNHVPGRATARPIGSTAITGVQA